ncbi:hypothetical protein PQE20_04835 [Vibrio harveyi]|uniref:hypothetical protein n=1 Tax=Vibrio harveyi TaxID=669 RepID=UPI00234DE1D5|nr:hypothetical protein [Vibrio harveyi]WCP81320.1 hypothetical protein PQE20_04835 [Vibrio harveyi]HDM8160448.1 hypothetical protein [Vibrio harveyi]
MKWTLWFITFIAVEVMAKEPLRVAINQTPYSAVLRLTSFEEIKQGVDAYYEIQADVLEEIRGNFSSHISFKMYAAKGDEPNLGAAASIIALCHDDQGYFWPGTGSEFKASKQNIAIAKEAAEYQTEEQELFSLCSQ